MTLLRQSIIAYGLLLVTLLGAWAAVVAPFHDQWKSKRVTNLQLQADRLNAESILSRAEQLNASKSRELESLVSSHSIGYASQATEAGHKLQAFLKPVLKKTSATILQLRPSNEAVADGLFKSALDINFRISSAQLQAFLIALSEAKPRLHIELLSIQNNARFVKQSNDELDISLNVAMWYVNDELLFTKSIEAAEGSLLANGSSSKRSAKANILAGLFNLTTRARLKQPSIAYYRLAAINVSQNTRTAIVDIAASGGSRKIKEGEMLDSWMVSSITSDGVILTWGGVQEVLTMNQ